MKSVLLAFCTTLLLATLLCSTASAADRPNIVLIFIDDMGWTDTSHAGSDLYETPNIDALAAGGMTFTNAYAAAGNCEPNPMFGKPDQQKKKSK